jgi:hypothetical protein
MITISRAPIARNKSQSNESQHHQVAAPPSNHCEFKLPCDCRQSSATFLPFYWHVHAVVDHVQMHWQGELAAAAAVFTVAVVVVVASVVSRPQQPLALPT